MNGTGENGIIATATERFRAYGMRRTLRHAAGFGLMVSLAALYTSDRTPHGIVSSASALSFGSARASAPGLDPFLPTDRTIAAIVNPNAQTREQAAALDNSFAMFGMGTPETPALRPSLDASFAMVTAAALDSDAMFGSQAPAAEAARLLPAPMAFGAPLPRSKPLVPVKPQKVEVASIAPMSGTESVLRTKSLDLETASGLPRLYPKGSAPYLEIIKREARANGVPLWVALGVAWVESKFNPKLRGSHSVMGMMQVMPSTARELGFRGPSEQLLDAETNIIWGMKELGKDYKMANGDVCMTIAKYTGGFMTKRVRPAAQRYCNEVKRVTGMG